MDVSSSPQTCVILLNWNGLQDTLNCLNSLTRATVVPDSIIVVDNGSSDDSVAGILQQAEQGSTPFVHVPGEPVPDPLPSYLLICSPRNLGFAGGNNLGLSLALSASNCRYIWLLNNDTLVERDTLAALLHCADRPGADIIGSTVVYADNPKQVQCAGGCGYNPWTTVFTPYLAGLSPERALEDQTSADLDYIFGASMFIRREVMERCGLLNEEYFLFYEELDLCMRARRAGFSMYWCREAIVLHRGSASVGRPDDGDRQKLFFANYHETLSTLLFTRRFYPALLPFVLPFRFFGKWAVVLSRGEGYLVKPLWAACTDFFTGRRRTLHEWDEHRS